MVKLTCTCRLFRSLFAVTDDRESDIIKREAFNGQVASTKTKVIESSLRSSSADS